ncbi:MAG: hypothetical protein R8G66_15325 [Cytophagales bacterium]|nr:hypothetical protein [Cytophagales bacterium]
MERSIESIWKEGFLNTETLNTPKINNLYSQKSLHIVERFKRMGKRNLYGIVIGAVVLFLYTLWVKIAWVGAFIVLLLSYLIWVGKRQAKELEHIQYGASSYIYLCSFNHWLQNAIEEYRRIYRYIYPILFLSIIVGMLYAELPGFESLITRIMNDPNTTLVQGLPIFWILPISTFIIAAFFLSEFLYKFDLNAIYGGIFRKLEELLQDMEELREG